MSQPKTIRPVAIVGANRIPFAGPVPAMPI